MLIQLNTLLWEAQMCSWCDDRVPLLSGFQRFWWEDSRGSRMTTVEPQHLQTQPLLTSQQTLEAAMSRLRQVANGMGATRSEIVHTKHLRTQTNSTQSRVLEIQSSMFSTASLTFTRSHSLRLSIFPSLFINGDNFE